jgi:NAD-dependent deacetylase
MAGWLLRESGAQHPGSAKRFECEVHGALTNEKVIKPEAAV